MERAIIVVAGTVAGVAGVLMYTPRPAAEASPMPEPVAAQPLPSAVPSTSPTTPAAPSASAQPPVPVVATVAGPLVETAFGPLQVVVTVEDGRITAADATTYPDKDPKSVKIARRAIPILVQETLDAQCADVAAVSGASYTSDGWKQSLAGALAQVSASVSTAQAATVAIAG